MSQPFSPHIATVEPQSNYTVAPNTIESTAPDFVDRRTTRHEDDNCANERRQFGSSHAGLTDEGRELALAIDQYKIEHHRRYLTCDEMLSVLLELGYRRSVS